ncbi:MAG: Fe-S oxidoreductase [Burkholderiales bacterium]|nr:Fe-S oxidoreductase [Burkholderiales bacterium]
MREGSLEAPIRHPIDWKSKDFYDESQIFTELERVFDICHGCRRCVSLCTAFPTLFDLVDDSETMEVDGVAKKDYWKVVDKCYLCDMCYMSKCPYVPPHEWNVDFPHLMLRAKALKFKKVGARFRDKLLSSTDALGKLASIPLVVHAVNAVNKNGAARKLMASTLAIAEKRELPEYSSSTFRKNASIREDFPVKDGKNTPGKVAIFSTCYINYNEPGIGQDLVQILEHNEIPAKIVEQEACCGMPKLELGDLDSVAILKDKNIPILARLAREGYAILTPVPSCTLMFKQELPLMFAEDEAVKAVAGAMFDPFEYLVLRNRDELLKTDFKVPLGVVSYHVPCHLRVQNMGQKTREMLEKVPGTTVTTVERCSGHDGTWGVKSEYFADSMKIGRPVFRQMGEPQPDYISSDCAIAGRHIAQGIRDSGTSPGEKQHPLSLIRIAYGI